MSHSNGSTLSAEYRHSWALIVGINDYKHLPPLRYAVNDARAIARVLTERFNFPSQRIIQLANGDATREAILSAFDETLTDRDRVGNNDRLLFFFAGHGLTRRGSQGEQGYIAPVDAKPRAWRSLIAMTDLTDLASFVPAKHIFFIMDACYSGLALARGGGLDSHVHSMLTRQAWQVLTAGKADEEVADGGGPRGDNSIFTGYLLEALNGGAIGRTGLLTASYVMGYVYRKLINDARSNQTPHFGWLRGDGDFIFQKPAIAVLPTPIEVALEHGGTDSRIKAILALSQLSQIEDEGIAHLATGRLERVARLDPAIRVRKQAASVLGWTPTPGPVQLSGNVLSHLKAALDTQQHQRPERAPRNGKRRLTIVGASLLIAAVACLMALTVLASARDQSEIDALQTLAAQEGALVATLVAGTPAPTINVPPNETQIAEEPQASATPSHSPTSAAQETGEAAEAEETREAIEESTIIFADNFSNISNRWELGGTSAVARTITDGQLRFFVDAQYALWVSRPNLPPQGDIVFSADATVLEGEEDFSYGLIFRQVDFDNYYYFLLNNQGHFLAVRQFGGVAEFLVELTPFEASLVPPGEPVTRLTVLAFGPNFTFFINGQPVAEVRDTAFATGRLGVVVQTLENSPAHVAFDNVVVQRP